MLMGKGLSCVPLGAFQRQTLLLVQILDLLLCFYIRHTLMLSFSPFCTCSFFLTQTANSIRMMYSYVNLTHKQNSRPARRGAANYCTREIESPRFNGTNNTTFTVHKHGYRPGRYTIFRQVCILQRRVTWIFEDHQWFTNRPS